MNDILLFQEADGVFQVVNDGTANASEGRVTLLYRKDLARPITTRAGIPDTKGSYLLVDTSTLSSDTQKFPVYVGRSGGIDLLPDSIEHADKRPPAKIDDWDVALLIHSEVLEGSVDRDAEFDDNVVMAAQIMLQRAADKCAVYEKSNLCVASQSQPDVSTKISVDASIALESLVELCMRTLQFIGVTILREEDVTISDLVKAEILDIDLYSLRPAASTGLQSAIADVLPDGRLTVRKEDGEMLAKASLSEVTNFVTKNSSAMSDVDPWTFWEADTDLTLADLRDSFLREHYLDSF